MKTQEARKVRTERESRKRWHKRRDEARWPGRTAAGALIGALAVVFAGADAFAVRSTTRQPKPSDTGPIHQFLSSSGVPIYAPVRVAKVSTVIRDRNKVRSVVKIVGPDKVPNPEDIKELRKIIEKKKRQGVPIKFDFSKKASELDLLRQNILSGEVIEFHTSEKLGELELFFSKDQSLKVEIGNDMFYIRIGDRDITFRSPSLRRQVASILEPREVKSREGIKSRGGGSRSPRKTAR